MSRSNLWTFKTASFFETGSGRTFFEPVLKVYEIAVEYAVSKHSRLWMEEIQLGFKRTNQVASFKNMKTTTGIFRNTFVLKYTSEHKAASCVGM